VSRENVEIVRDSWRAFADGGSDAMTEFWVPEIDWRGQLAAQRQDRGLRD